MGRSGLLISIFLLVMAWSAQSRAEVFLDLKEVYLPVGYDTDDTVEILFVVHLPDSCHKIEAVSTEVNRNRQVQVGVTTKRFEGDCHNGPIPIAQVLSLGRLRNKGTYSIVDKGTGLSVGDLEVAVATESVHGTDQRLYPALTDAFLRAKEVGWSLVLRGVYSDSCQSMDKVTFRASDKVLVALPELTHPDREDCTPAFIPFEEEFEVTGPVPTKTMLLHVRGAGGRSFSKLQMQPPVR